MNHSNTCVVKKTQKNNEKILLLLRIECVSFGVKEMFQKYRCIYMYVGDVQKDDFHYSSFTIISYLLKCAGSCVHSTFTTMKTFTVCCFGFFPQVKASSL